MDDIDMYIYWMYFLIYELFFFYFRYYNCDVVSMFVDCICMILCMWMEMFKCWIFVNKCFFYYKVVNV